MLYLSGFELYSGWVSLYYAFVACVAVSLKLVVLYYACGAASL